MTDFFGFLLVGFKGVGLRVYSGGPKGGHLKGGHLISKWDFAVDMSSLTALSKEIPQAKVRLDRESAV